LGLIIVCRTKTLGLIKYWPGLHHIDLAQWSNDSTVTNQKSLASLTLITSWEIWIAQFLVVSLRIS
jgi:hypothetical protein